MKINYNENSANFKKLTIKAEKVDNFVFRQKFSPKDEFKSKVFDQI